MDNIKQQLEEMYNKQGLSISEISKKLNTSYGTVRRYFMIAGIEFRKKKRQTKEQIIADRKSKEDILRLLKKHAWSIMKVAKILDVKYSHLKIWMEFYKIPQKFSRKGKGEKMSNEDFIKKFEDWTDFNLKNPN